MNNKNIYVVKVYGSKDVTYKITIDFAEKSSLDIDLDYKDNKNIMTITLLDEKQQNGYLVELTKTKSDVSEGLDFSINLVELSEITGKIEFTSNLVNSGSLYTLKNKIDVNISKISFNIQFNSEINFKSVDIKNLTEENCEFLDELDPDIQKTKIDAIREKGIDVIDTKLVSQGLKSIKNEENDNKGTETPGTIDMISTREEIKQKIEESLLEARARAESEGRVYTINDLIDLEITDSAVSVSINGDEAILNVDGLDFKINSNFEIYE